MHSLVEQHRSEIEASCRRFHVQRLDLFGSAATGGFDSATSDVDFLLELEPLSDAEYVAAWFGLREALEFILQRPIDLVSASAVRNPFFRAELERTRLNLHAA